jgi:hypothetical protein
MLGRTGLQHPAPQMFREAILRVLRDPLRHPDQWRWATWYWDMSDLHPGPEVRALFDAAVRTIQEAGFDPVSFGRPRTA